MLQQLKNDIGKKSNEKNNKTILLEYSFLLRKNDIMRHDSGQQKINRKWSISEMVITLIDLDNSISSNYLNLANTFEKDTILRNREPKTAKQYRKNAMDYIILTGIEQFRPETNFLTFVGNLSIFLNYLQNKGYSFKTQKLYFTGLNAFFEYLLFQNIISINPVPSFRARYLTIYKEPETPECKQCTPEEVKLLIDAAPNALWRAIIALYASTGMRRQELVDLNVRDVNLEQRVIIVPKKKKRSNRYIIFSEWALDYLIDYLELRVD